MGFLDSLWTTVCDFLRDYVAEPFCHITVRDVIDIVILAVLLHGIYLFAKTRRAGRVLYGLVAVVAFFAIVTAVGLPTLTFISRLFASTAFFCSVLIFQPEIRDGLERIGNARAMNPRGDTLPRRQLPAARQMTDEVVDAVFSMSDSCTGALIVFEGLTSLGEFAESGRPVDAAVTSYLLQNIFYDKAPLHDGAMIIRNMRIWRASCVLPSAASRMDFGHMGTRHRAAVGLTEVSDALVVVVSEQTGVVSVAQDGKLIRGVDRETLRDILMTYVAGRLYLRTKKQEAKAVRISEEMSERAERAVKEKKKREKKD